VVLAIIAILIALLLPVFQKARLKSRKIKAQAEVSQIAMAWNSLLNDYRTWAAAGVNAGSVKEMGIPEVAILNGGNPKHFVYYEATNAPFADPWGVTYAVRLDPNYVNSVDTSGNPPNSPHGTVQRNVAVWSKGPLNGVGGEKDDPSDDIVSWGQ